jgi:hypothetical protein
VFLRQAARFGSQLASVINAQVKAIEQREKRVANDNSWTLALLLTGLTTKEDLIADDFLPYPLEKQSLDSETAAVIKKLMATGKLNRKVVSILGGLKLLPT